MQKGKRTTDFGAACYAQNHFRRERESWHQLINLRKELPMDISESYFELQKDRVLTAFHAYRILEKNWKNNL